MIEKKQKEELSGIEVERKINEGRWHFSNAIISGSVNLRGRIIKRSLWFKEIIIDGDLYMPDGFIEGDLDLSGATIKGSLVLKGTVIKGDLNLTGTKLTEGFLDLRMKEGPGIVLVSPDLAPLIHCAAPMVPLVIWIGERKAKEATDDR